MVLLIRAFCRCFSLGFFPWFFLRVFAWVCPWGFPIYSLSFSLWFLLGFGWFLGLSAVFVLGLLVFLRGFDLNRFLFVFLFLMFSVVIF